MPKQAVIHAERLALVKVLLVDADATFKILGMNPLKPAISTLLLKRSAGELKPSLVEVITELVGAGSPDQANGAVGQIAQVVLALTQRHLGTLVDKQQDSPALGRCLFMQVNDVYVGDNGFTADSHAQQMERLGRLVRAVTQ